MITRVFAFTPDETGKRDFRLVHLTFAGQKMSKEDRRYLAEIQRELDAISEPIGSSSDELDARPRKLIEAGGTISLSQKAHEKMDGYLNEAAWPAGLSIAIEDLLDRWSAAEKAGTA